MDHTKPHDIVSKLHGYIAPSLVYFDGARD